MKFAIVAIAAFAFGCGSVQEEKPAAPKEEVCQGKPGKVRLILVDDNGKAVCNAKAALRMASGQTGSQTARSLGEADGKAICGFIMEEPGEATLEAQGYTNQPVTWSKPKDCEVNDVRVVFK